MQVLVFEPEKEPCVKEIDGSLKSMQAIVGGWIEIVHLPQDKEFLLVINDEALLLGLQWNRFFGRSEPILGTTFICRDEYSKPGYEGQMLSLTNEEAEYLAEKYMYPMFMR